MKKHIFIIILSRWGATPGVCWFLDLFYKYAQKKIMFRSVEGNTWIWDLHSLYIQKPNGSNKHIKTLTKIT